ncbi:MAG: 30S ribosomal protein S13 [Minisyncoccales bacterium]
MVRLKGVEIPDKKQIWLGLTKIYGIGRSLSFKILKDLKIDPYKKGEELSAEELNKIQKMIEANFKIEGELKREKLLAIKRLKELGTWRGLRHIKKLPVRGQRTRTNTRTLRGNVRKTVGSGKKPGPAPK